MRSSLLSLLGIVFLQSVAYADIVSVNTFGYPSASGPVSFVVPSGIDLNSELLARLRQAMDHVNEVKIYCAGSPGPRFMQIDGHFYTLNGKSRRDGAFVETNVGHFEVTDSMDQSILFSNDYQLLSDLVSYAQQAC